MKEGFERLLADATFEFLSGNLDDCRQERKDDDNRNDLVYMVMDVGNHLTEKIAAKHCCYHPADTASDVIDDEAFVFHCADAGDHRRERSKYRDKPRDHDGERSVALIKFLGGNEVLAVE